MKNAEEDRELIKHYLLGDLSGKERELFEENVITDPDYREKVLVVEGELIEDYLEDDLLELDRRKFVQHFLSTPQQLQKLELSRSLKKYAAAAVSSPSGNIPRPSTDAPRRIKRRSWWSQFLLLRRPVVGFSLAVVILLVLITTWLLVARNRRMAFELELAKLNNQSSSELPLSATGSVLSVMLTPGQLRGGADKENNITILSSTNVVQLQLALTQDEYPSYRATLITVEGAEIFTLDGLKAKDFSGVRQVILNIPARILTKADYLLTLSSSTTDGRFVEVAEYSFRVAKG